MKIVKWGVNMITENDNQLSYLLKKHLRQEAIVTPSEHELISAADILKTQVIELLKRDGNLSQAKKLDSSKVIKLSIDIAILLSEIGFSALGVQASKKNFSNDGNHGSRQGHTLESSKNSEAEFNQASDNFVYVDNLTLIRASKQVMLKEKCLHVTPNEFSLLMLLINEMGAIVSKELLSQQGLGKKFQSNHRTVDVHISNLRKKLGLDSKERERIKTVRGFGYQYVIYPDE